MSTYAYITWDVYDLNKCQKYIILQLKTITNKLGYRYYTRYEKCTDSGDDINRIGIGLKMSSWVLGDIRNCINELNATFLANHITYSIKYENLLY